MPKKTVLVVDDERNARELLKTVLEGVDYHVVTRGDGLSALKALYSTPCDLILMDINLPDKDGIETTQVIRNNQRIRHIPIIMLTAQGDKRSVLRAIQAGANDYVVKPFNVDTLLEKIARLLGRSGLDGMVGDADHGGGGGGDMGPVEDSGSPLDKYLG